MGARPAHAPAAGCPPPCSSIQVCNVTHSPGACIWDSPVLSCRWVSAVLRQITDLRSHCGASWEGVLSTPPAKLAWNRTSSRPARLAPNLNPSVRHCADAPALRYQNTHRTAFFAAATKFSMYSEDADPEASALPPLAAAALPSPPSPAAALPSAATSAAFMAYCSACATRNV